MKETPRKENNSYVVFIWNIYGSAGKVRGGGVTPPAPAPYYAGFWPDIWRRRERFLLHLGYLLHVCEQVYCTYEHFLIYDLGLAPDPFNLNASLSDGKNATWPDGLSHVV